MRGDQAIAITRSPPARRELSLISQQIGRLENLKGRLETRRRELGGMLAGEPGKAAGLPPKGLTRWNAHRKAAVITSIKDGLITEAQACDHYCISVEELRSWQGLFDKYGLNGLRTTRIQLYRREVHDMAPA